MSTNGNKLSRSQFKAEFARIVSSSTFDLYCDETREKFIKLDQFSKANIPDELFRFRKCGIEDLISFEQETIPMSVAEKFSDIYDSNIFYDYRNMEERYRRLYSHLIPYFILSVKCNPSMYAIVPLLEDYFENESTDYFSPEFCKSILEDKIIFLGIVADLARYINSLIVNPRTDQSKKIACFTEDIKSKFMWDSYADGYKGFALKYDLKKMQNSKAAQENVTCLFPVIYSSRKYDATEYLDRKCLNNLLEMIRKNEECMNWMEAHKIELPSLLLTDHFSSIKQYLYKDKKEYAHEKEWRLIKFDKPNNGRDFVSIPAHGYLKAIYYGPNIEPRYKKHLSSIAKSKGIEEYNVWLNDGSPEYKLKVVKEK